MKTKEMYVVVANEFLTTEEPYLKLDEAVDHAKSLMEDANDSDDFVIVYKLVPVKKVKMAALVEDINQ